MVSSDSFMYIKNERPQFAQRGPLDAVNSPTYAELKQAFKVVKLQSDKQIYF